MKIVINRCFGGFGLSNEAYEKLLDRKGIAWEKTEEGAFRLCHYYEAGHVGSNDHYISPYDHYNNRNDEDLIAVIEEMGVANANGDYAELKIVEIPDDVEYTIEEYDGLEHIAEAHRKWS